MTEQHRLTFILIFDDTDDNSINSATKQRPKHIKWAYHDFCNAIFNYMRGLEHNGDIRIFNDSTKKRTYNHNNCGYRGSDANTMESYYIPFEVMNGGIEVSDSAISIKVRISGLKHENYKIFPNEEIVPIIVRSRTFVGDDEKKIAKEDIQSFIETQRKLYKAKPKT